MEWGWPLVIGGGVIVALFHFVPVLFVRRQQGAQLPELEAALGEALQARRHLVLRIDEADEKDRDEDAALRVPREDVVALDARQHPELVRALNLSRFPAWVVVREGRVVHVATRIRTPAQLQALLE